MLRWTGRTGLLLPILLCVPLFSASAETVTNEDCLDCHDLDTAGWEASVHFAADLGCLDCHADRETIPHDENQSLPSCADCHDDIAGEFNEGVHNKVRAELFASAGGCPTCHGVHDVRSPDDPDSPTNPRNVGQLCGQCHADPSIAEKHGLDTRVVKFYENSVHGQRNQDGVHAATCGDCHGVHRTLRASNPESKVNPFLIVKTCGECHDQEASDYLVSVHGKAFERGITAAPVCTDCHGFHRIKATPETELTKRVGRSARHSCPACHGSEALMGEFGIAATRVSSYRNSYHGLASARGGKAVADCASCHGVHDILPATDPDSRVAPWNLEKTCGKCHENANARFTETPVHYTEDVTVASSDVKITQWVKRIYWILLIGVLGGMVLHNLIVLSWYVRRRWREEQASASIRRFGKRQIAQHTILLITFFLLVLSGFMLAYPGTWWSQFFVKLGLSEHTRQWIHRVPAIALMVTSIYHMWWLLFTSRGHLELGRIRPRLSDLREVVTNMRFHLGRTDEHPAAGKYDYPAKAEYWALVWGTFVMVATGLILWFPEVATEWMPGWAIKVAQVIHLYEAWLATLAILIFHFFYVIGHPESYPLSFAMMTGKMSRKHAERHHPKWVAEVDAREQSADH